ncbi:hypothetical protein U1Q18_027710 [Sarracenia purpurea var. burkii]
MAEVSYLHLQDDRDDDQDDVVVTLDSVPYWSHDFDVFNSDPEFPPSDLSLPPDSRITTVLQRDPDRIRGSNEVSGPDPITTVDFFDRENQVNFVIDLFHQRVEQLSMGGDEGLVSPDPNLDPYFGDDEMGSIHSELDLGLGLGFCIGRHSLADDDTADRDCDCGDEFFVLRRDSSEPGELSTVCGGGEHFAGGLRVVGIASDSAEDENEVMGIDLNAEDDCGLDNACDDDTSLNLCWDSFLLEDHRDATEDFEWEEVDGRVEEREVLSMFFDANVDEDLDGSVTTVIPSPEEIGVERGEGALWNLEWEVLLNVHNLEGNLHQEDDDEPHFGHHDEYEILFGQFTENENAMVGSPPASKTVVENLPSVVLSQEDEDTGDSLCAICKDGIDVGEQAKQLPCSHHYHGSCIVPWLGIRNTCPVCRYELPTDDADYEWRRRSHRDGQDH